MWAVVSAIFQISLRYSPGMLRCFWHPSLFKSHLGIFTNKKGGLRRFWEWDALNSLVECFRNMSFTKYLLFTYWYVFYQLKSLHLSCMFFLVFNNYIWSINVDCCVSVDWEITEDSDTLTFNHWHRIVFMPVNRSVDLVVSTCFSMWIFSYFIEEIFYIRFVLAPDSPKKRWSIDSLNLLQNSHFGSAPFLRTLSW